MKLTIPGPPIPKERPRIRNGRAYTPAKTKAYEQKVAMYARAAGVKTMLDGPIYMSIDLYFPDRRRRDGDNVVKALLDALNLLAYQDDHQVKEVHYRMRYDKDAPRVELEFYSHPEPDGWV